jgi:phosphate-selective porin OprO/OprP
LWVEQTSIPVLGNVRLGQWKQPFSLEVMSSFRYTTFMERSLLFQPFTPFRHLGAGLYDHSDDLAWTWAASGFRAGQDQFGGSISTSGGWATAERLTHLLYWDEPSGGRYYLHGGIGHYYSNPPNNTVNFRTIPELFIGDVGNSTQVGTSGQPTPGPNNGTPFFVETGPLNVRNFNVVGAEALFVYGPFSFQSEAMVNFVDQFNQPDVVLPGAYAQVGYFLTGEHRPYDRQAGAIDRIQPFTNFFCVDTNGGHCTGSGAWEVAGRFSYLDLNDRNIRGGTLTDFTAGVNWYWNPYTKIMFNYIHASNDSSTLDPSTLLPIGRNHTDMYAARVQVDF